MSDNDNIHRLDVPVGDGVVLPPDDILSEAVGRLSSLALVGFDDDGRLYIAGSHGLAETVLLLEQAKVHLLAPDGTEDL